jgi:hypothetical protein
MGTREQSMADIRQAIDDLRDEIECGLIGWVSADAPPRMLAAVRELTVRSIAGLYEAADIIGEHRGEPPRTDAIKRHDGQAAAKQSAIAEQ